MRVLFLAQPGKALSGARLLQCSGTPSKERFRGTVSRILSSLFTAERIIYLSSLTRVSVPFGTRSGPLLEPPIWPCTRRGFPCPRDCSHGGGLLHHLFTLAWLLPAGRFVFCGTFRQHALKRAAHVYSHRSEITWRRALWCSDFPPPQVEAILRSSETA